MAQTIGQSESLQYQLFYTILHVIFQQYEYKIHDNLNQCKDIFLMLLKEIKHHISFHEFEGVVGSRTSCTTFRVGGENYNNQQQILTAIINCITRHQILFSASHHMQFMIPCEIGVLSGYWFWETAEDDLTCITAPGQHTGCDSFIWNKLRVRRYMRKPLADPAYHRCELYRK